MSTSYDDLFEKIQSRTTTNDDFDLIAKYIDGDPKKLKSILQLAIENNNLALVEFFSNHPSIQDCTLTRATDPPLDKNRMELFQLYNIAISIKDREQVGMLSALAKFKIIQDAVAWRLDLSQKAISKATDERSRESARRTANQIAQETALIREIIQKQKEKEAKHAGENLEIQQSQKTEKPLTFSSAPTSTTPAAPASVAATPVATSTSVLAVAAASSSAIALAKESEQVNWTLIAQQVMKEELDRLINSGQNSPNIRDLMSPDGPRAKQLIKLLESLPKISGEADILVFSVGSDAPERDGIDGTIQQSPAFAIEAARQGKKVAVVNIDPAFGDRAEIDKKLSKENLSIYKFGVFFPVASKTLPKQLEAFFGAYLKKDSNNQIVLLYCVNPPSFAQTLGKTGSFSGLVDLFESGQVKIIQSYFTTDPCIIYDADMLKKLQDNENYVLSIAHLLKPKPPTERLQEVGVETIKVVSTLPELTVEELGFSSRGVSKPKK